MARPIKLARLKERIDKAENTLKDVQEKIKTKPKRAEIKNGTYTYELKKALKNPNFSNKTVLTDSTWDYVLTYMQNNKKKEEAIFYWEQAMNFYEATKNLSIISAPLTSYYCFLNATKALLIYKGINFNYKHGVSGKRENGRIILQNEKVKLQKSGVLSGLCEYFEQKIQEPEEYSLKDLLYNLPYIHRAYSLSYKSEAELFIPIINPRFVCDAGRKDGWFEFELEREYSNKSTLNKLKGYSVDKYYSFAENYVLRRNKIFKWECTRNKPSEESQRRFKNYYKNIRKSIYYIYSPNELWYLKRKDLSTERIINKHTLVITMAAMHRLSELSRYEPQTLKKHLEKDQSWLLREFINKSLVQFIDTISSEITGDDFRQTGFRN